MAGTTITEVSLLVAMILISVYQVVPETLGCDHLLEGHNLTRVGNYQSASDKVVFTNTSVKVCTLGQCCEISNDKLQLLFPNTFMNVSYYIRETNLPYHTRIKENYASRERQSGQLQRSSVRRKRTGTSCDGLPPSDGDLCCPTHRYATVYSGEMQNTSDETCVIFDSRPLFQMVTEGICCQDVLCNQGRSCRQRYTAQSLLALNKDRHAIRFELFDIPTYCSCI